MYAAAKIGNRHLAFMSLISSNAMFSEISRYNALRGYDAQDLYKTARTYDDILSEYLKEYQKAGIQAKHYSNIDAFVYDYEANQNQ